MPGVGKESGFFSLLVCGTLNHRQHGLHCPYRHIDPVVVFAHAQSWLSTMSIQYLGLSSLLSFTHTITDTFYPSILDYRSHFMNAEKPLSTEKLQRQQRKSMLANKPQLKTMTNTHHFPRMALHLLTESQISGLQPFATMLGLAR